MDWQIFLVGVGLFLVFEGIFPFLSPKGFKKHVENVSLLTERSLRVIGLVSMVIGVVVLYLAR